MAVSYAPIPAVLVATTDRLKSSLKSHSWPTSVERVGPTRERTFAPDFGICQSPAHASSPSNAFASFRSGVLKPSVNHS
jgi:hypothetical protein